ncbi:hypothetical protein ACFQ0M_00410 [Kitasatospora aburaviensis]
MTEGAPQLHGTADPFVRDPVRNILLEIHADIGDVDAGFADADVIHEGTYSSRACSTRTWRPTARSPGWRTAA